MKIKLASVVASITLASAVAFAPAVNAKGYLTSSDSKVVTSGYGLCWDGIWTNPSTCGDEPVAMMEADEDMDGVPDSKDKCPGTPKGVLVDVDGCPADTDGDGVPDYKDKCPGTPKGAKVDSDGCEIIGNITINLVNDEFDFDSAALKTDMKSALDGVISKLKASKGNEQLDIVGHTDSSGPAEYNQGLSERRAQSVADYMAAGGIDAGSMTVSGQGESQPVADNGTREGRQQNRRVEIMTK